MLIVSVVVAYHRRNTTLKIHYSENEIEGA